jgi:2-polyprenyl-3-methyl-5-hydroxy-6-metoxy-1,4-benzoquinol methylase
MESDWTQAHEETREAWDENASFWDQRMGEGNDFVEVLVWPATRPLLDPQPGQRILDVACGNGLYARKVAALGADVVGFDFSAGMIARAREHTFAGPGRIDYRVLDGTDEVALLGLGEGTFHAAMCNMALFDMAEIDPLMRSVVRLLRPGGPFVFSVLHPCFNNPFMAFVGECEDRDGDVVTTHSVKVWRYMTAGHRRGVAIVGQPAPQYYFHRPLGVLLGSALAAGFMLDALEERAFPPDHPPGRSPLSWGANFSEIPPVLVARLRTVG